MLGGVEYFTDLEWSIEPGIAFCAQGPAAARSRCYGLIGRRRARMRASSTAALRR